MKKTLLAVLVLPAMFVAGTANATFIESQDGFTGKLDFNGTIVNKAPNWAWEIPDASVAKVKDWALDLQQSNIVESNNVWNLGNKGQLIALHGYMVSASGHGAPGLTPVIELNGIKLAGGIQQIELVATGTVGGKAVAAGAFKMNISSVLGVVSKQGDHIWKVEDSQGTWPSTKAAMVAMQQKPIADLKLKYPGLDVWDQYGEPTWEKAEKYLQGNENLDVIGQFVAEAGDFQLIYPTASIPDTWNTSLPIVVTMK